MMLSSSIKGASAEQLQNWNEAQVFGTRSQILCNKAAENPAFRLVGHLGVCVPTNYAVTYLLGHHILHAR